MIVQLLRSLEKALDQAEQNRNAGVSCPGRNRGQWTCWMDMETFHRIVSHRRAQGHAISQGIQREVPAPEEAWR